MAEYYLRVDAVNLGNTVYDTNDISTIRGSSYMLLHAVNELKKFPGLAPISVGASTGIFKLTEGNDPEKTRKAVENELRARTSGYATFVVDVVDKDGLTFKQVQEHLLAQNRWRQWQQLTVPLGLGWKSAATPCALNGVLAADTFDRFPENEIKEVSSSVKLRRDAGKQLRQTVYEHILGSCNDDFTDDLETLSNDPSQGSLDGKIAFIYLDGNRFGTLRDRLCPEPDLLSQFDKAVQDNFRNKVLKDILDHMRNDSASVTPTPKKIRLETLLWGGDEIQWVVPAWKGWEILQMFYAFTPQPFQGQELTHAAGLVFCHHSANILQIRNLAHDLAEEAKSTLTPGVLPDRANGDCFHYLVLESHDMVEVSVRDFIPRFYRPATLGDLLMKGCEMPAFSSDMAVLRRYFPRNKVYDIVRAIQGGRIGDVNAIVDRGLSGNPGPLVSRVKEAIGRLTGQNQNRWFLIADLWDYV